MVFSEKGYHLASVSDIVEHAGIARGTFYQYFDNKRHVKETSVEATKQRPTSANGEGPAADGDIDVLIEQMVSEKRADLEKDMGLEEEETRQFEKPVERPFTKSQRPHTTLLVGGLTIKHEHLIHGALLGMGYKCENPHLT
jgi:AcrR family transcriptional regulator